MSSRRDFLFCGRKRHKKGKTWGSKEVMEETKGMSLRTRKVNDGQSS